MVQQYRCSGSIYEFPCSPFDCFGATMGQMNKDILPVRSERKLLWVVRHILVRRLIDIFTNHCSPGGVITPRITTKNSNR